MRVATLNFRFSPFPFYSSPFTRQFPPTFLLFFSQGITGYVEQCKGIMGKTAASALKSKEGKGASPAVKEALAAAAAFAPVKAAKDE